MCRNIKMLFNFDPPVTAEEVRAASLQFVRKISGFNKPSKANEAAFLGAIDEIAAISTRLLHSLDTNAPPKNREEEAAKAKARAAERFGAGGGRGFCVYGNLPRSHGSDRLQYWRVRLGAPNAGTIEGRLDVA